METSFLFAQQNAYSSLLGYCSQTGKLCGGKVNDRARGQNNTFSAYTVQIMYGKTANRLLGRSTPKKARTGWDRRTKHLDFTAQKYTVLRFALHPLFVFEQFLPLLSFSPFVQAMPHKKLRFKKLWSPNNTTSLGKLRKHEKHKA